MSCSKSNKAIKPIVGIWNGTLTVDGQPQVGELIYTFDIRADSTIVTQSEGTDGNTYTNHGTWSLSGNSFQSITAADLNGVIQTQTAIYNGEDGTLTNGIWKNQNGSAKGTFSLKRVN